MGSLFLTTILSCNQVIGVLNRLQNIALLSPQQKVEILAELKRVAPSCPVIIKSNDKKTKAGN
jgi:hypothetical protein